MGSSVHTSSKKRQRILCIDDDPGIAVLLDRVLSEGGGFECRFESDPNHALELALAFDPELMIIDVRMPGHSGLDLVREFRDLPQFRDRPIILFTSLISGDRSSPVTMLEGPTEFLPKGAPNQVLLGTVERLLGATHT